jgi:cell division protein FtsL
LKNKVKKFCKKHGSKAFNGISLATILTLAGGIIDLFHEKSNNTEMTATVWQHIHQKELEIQTNQTDIIKLSNENRELSKRVSLLELKK